MRSRPPIAGVACDRRFVDGHAFQMAGEKYLQAMREAAGALPLLIPSFDPPLNANDVLASVDGLLLTGAVSNVDPAHYGGAEPREGNIADAHRDGTTLALIRAALERGMPCLFICRGHQELNVALGGTLFQHVREQPGRIDHSDDGKTGKEAKYAPAHRVDVTPGGLLARITGEEHFDVNSLHGQAIDHLAPGLAIEAVAPDGTIEAVSVKDAKGFALSLQWHPEWAWADNAQSCAIFAAFGAALKERTR